MRINAGLARACSTPNAGELAVVAMKNNPLIVPTVAPIMQTAQRQ